MKLFSSFFRPSGLQCLATQKELLAMIYWRAQLQPQLHFHLFAADTEPTITFCLCALSIYFFFLFAWLVCWLQQSAATETREHV
jgi:hypothetical protein